LAQMPAAGAAPCGQPVTVPAVRPPSPVRRACGETEPRAGDESARGLGRHRHAL